MARHQHDFQRGYLHGRVGALGRSIAKLRARPWARHPLVELARVARGAVLDYESLQEAAAGCRVELNFYHISAC